MNEFDLIRRLQDTVCPAGGAADPSIAVAIGDDAAVLNPVPGQQLVVTTDTLNSGIHFPADTPAGDIAWKSLAVSLSDLAAMGADPCWFFLNLSLPEGDAAWLDAFAAGLQALASATGIRLCGGDTTAGPLSVTVTAIGQVPRQQALLRSTACAGDLVVVSGHLGRAARALHLHQAGDMVDADDWQALVRPVPRLALGRALRGAATACIDLSDGLAADLGHIAAASPAAPGAEVLLGRLSVPASLAALPEAERWALQLTGGDDYELCFTLPPEREHRLPDLAALGGVPLTVIGRMTDHSGVRLLQPSGEAFRPARRGFDHFAGGQVC